ncbi:hypothetical protein TNCV_2142111 [Trichonephila clavipes]|uniref:Uncharacterized protein n=1 Tax=Trichonephila clavipes TaxID=2585209 RepID=A0A8X6VAW9_TRICX|nr:hypothetical protein TNCV_2142111 [Trichonephila clavipes]
MIDEPLMKAMKAYLSPLERDLRGKVSLNDSCLLKWIMTGPLKKAGWAACGAAGWSERWPIGVNVHCTQHPIREQSLSSQPSQKTQKLSTQMKNHSHASRIPSPDQSPSCHSAEWKTPLLPCPTS